MEISGKTIFKRSWVAENMPAVAGRLVTITVRFLKWRRLRL